MSLIPENFLCFPARVSERKYEVRKTRDVSEPKKKAEWLALRKGERLIRETETSSSEVCLGLLLSNQRPHQRGGDVTRTLSGGN